MQAAISKWGNSLAVRLPSQIAKETNLAEGSTVELVVEDGSVIMKPTIPRYKLSELLAQMKPEHRHDEVDFGARQGNEIW